MNTFKSTTVKSALFVAAAVVAAHAITGAFAAKSMQLKANVAVMPIVKAERIEVRPMQIVKADKITVSAKKPVQVALTHWNKVA